METLFEVWAPLCVLFCTVEVESVLHVFRDCPTVVMVWSHLVKFEYRSNFFFGDLHQQVHLNMSKDVGMIKDLEWA